jgi:phosphate/sulfate permease
LFLATWLGVPVSTTHTITGAIVGKIGEQALRGALGCGRQHHWAGS